FPGRAVARVGAGMERASPGAPRSRSAPGRPRSLTQKGSGTMTDGSATPAIAARGVGKSFGEHRVLDQVDLTVAEGTIFSLLGPNGAGKTTIVRILSTLISADAGQIRVAGHDLATESRAV